MSYPLTLIAGADWFYTFDSVADSVSGVATDLTPYALKASLSYSPEDEPLVVITEGSGITKQPFSFTLLFTAAQTAPCREGIYLSIQLASGGKLQMQIEVPLRVEKNLIPVSL